MARIVKVTTSIILLAFIAVGCASLQSNRLVDVEVSSSDSSNLSAAKAVEVFYVVTYQFALVEKNITHDSRTPDFIQHVAESSGQSVSNYIRFDLMCHNDDSDFIITIYGRGQDIARAERVSGVVQSELDKLGVRYKVRKGLQTGGLLVRHYPATVTSPADGAIIHRVTIHHPFQRGGLYAQLDRIDGIRPFDDSDKVLVDPGARVLSISSSQLWTIIFVDYADVKLKAMLRAGHEYEPKAERKGDEVTFWVEDAGTHELASDRQTAKVWVGIH